MKTGYFRKDRTVDTQEVTDSSSVEPTTSQRLTPGKSYLHDPFDLLIHRKRRRNGRHLVGRAVRRELAQGPATAFELAASLGWIVKHGERAGMRRASAWCANLLWTGEVEHAGQVRASTGRLCWLYRLTGKGQTR
jgi:hypothetical protein